MNKWILLTGIIPLLFIMGCCSETYTENDYPDNVDQMSYQELKSLGLPIKCYDDYEIIYIYGDYEYTKYKGQNMVEIKKNGKYYSNDPEALELFSQMGEDCNWVVDEYPEEDYSGETTNSGWFSENYHCEPAPYVTMDLFETSGNVCNYNDYIQ
ncbi:hypothetical protein J7J90_02450 [Candidatus Micrarchaeota archaeon]|nr:hypothetical protein [Candidatus Micrarchaeota archaeon]